MKISVKLWTINNLLRFTGFRLFYAKTMNSDDPEDYETRVGLMWWGSPFNDGSSPRIPSSAFMADQRSNPSPPPPPPLGSDPGRH